MKFDAEGNVTMCCFHQRKCLGNILKSSLEAIWNSPLANEIRETTLAGRLHRTCKVESCPFLRAKLEPKEFAQKELPTEFEIDLPTSHCNVGGTFPTKQNPACLMCERHLRNPKTYQQPDRLEELCAKLKPYIGHIDWLHIQGVSEPFWKDRLFEILNWLDVEPYKEKIWISTTTNGTLMNERHRKMFLHYPKSTITWSLDAATPEVYKAIRRLDMYDRIVQNLDEYCIGRTQGQYVHIHNNINTINIGDVERMVELAAAVKVDRLDFNATYGVPSICVNENNFIMFKEAQEKIVKRAGELGVYVTFMRNLALDYANYNSL